jgi:segregation and condensation protein B
MSDATPDYAILIEALLFVADGPVSVERLAQALETSPAIVESALARMAASLAERGLRVQRRGRDVQLVTVPAAARAIERFLGLEDTGRLSAAALETLAIIAYRQPITRAAIEQLRGVNCEHVLRSLVARGLIEEVGRQETVGRPVLYGTSFGFLRYFGLGALDELPPLPEEDTSPTAGHLAQHR